MQNIGVNFVVETNDKLENHVWLGQKNVFTNMRMRLKKNTLVDEEHFWQISSEHQWILMSTGENEGQQHLDR